MGLGILTNYRRIKRWYREIYKYKSKSGITVKIPYFTKLKYNLLGFTDYQYVIYDLKNNDYHEYINARERNKLEDINGRFAFFLGEKVMFERVFGNFVHVPHIYFWVKNGKFLDLDKGCKADIITVLKNQKALIAKPTRSTGGGKGVHLFEYINDKFCLDGAEISENGLLDKAANLEGHIFTQRVISHKYAREIYPYSTNSIRIVTAYDKNSDDIGILFASHRFGTNKSMPVDNISSGGVFAYVDSETGKMNEACSIFEPQRKFTVHPDTGAQIEGVEIPGWKNITQELINAHKCFPYYKFFAWDVAIDENNIPYILEINRGSELNFQVGKPMRNEALGKFMRAEGLLDKF